MNDNGFPHKLLFRMGGYIGSFIELQWNGKELVYGESECGPYIDADNQKILVPNEAEWKHFWTDIRNIGVWYWKEQYDNNTVCDGIYWELELAYKDKKFKSQGSNAYPPKGADIPSESFKQLLRVFGELMNDRDFIQAWYYSPWD